MIGHTKRLTIVFSVTVALGLLASCVAPTGPTADGSNGLRARLVAANLLAGSLAEGLNSALRGGAISPHADRALLIVQTLDAVERSLDSAATALRAHLPEMAARQIGAAESQLGGLQPLLSTPARTENAGDAP